MKKIISGKVYDTEKAKFVYKFEDNLYVNTLFKKRTGEYFMHTSRNNSFGVVHETISPIDIETAKKILKPYKDVYDNEFGIVDENVILSLSLTDENNKKIREYATNTGVSVSSVLNAIISIYFNYIISN